MCCGLMTTRNELRSYSTQTYSTAFLAFGVRVPRMFELIEHCAHLVMFTDNQCGAMN